MYYYVCFPIIAQVVFMIIFYSYVGDDFLAVLLKLLPTAAETSGGLVCNLCTYTMYVCICTCIYVRLCPCFMCMSGKVELYLGVQCTKLTKNFPWCKMELVCGPEATCTCIFTDYDWLRYFSCPM